MYPLVEVYSSGIGITPLSSNTKIWGIKHQISIESQLIIQQIKINYYVQSKARYWTNKLTLNLNTSSYFVVMN